MTGINKLPDDCFKLIGDQFFNVFDIEQTRSSAQDIHDGARSRLQTLLACALALRRWTPIALAQLLLILPLDSRNVGKVARVLESTAESDHVRWLACGRIDDVAHEQLAIIIRLCSSVQGFSAGELSWTALRRTELPATLQTIIWNQPNRHHANLFHHDTRLSVCRASTILMVDREGPVQRMRDLDWSGLRELEWTPAWTDENVEAFVGILDHAQQLASLRLEHYDAALMRIFICRSDLGARKSLRRLTIVCDSALPPFTLDGIPPQLRQLTLVFNTGHNPSNLTQTDVDALTAALERRGLLTDLRTLRIDHYDEDDGTIAWRARHRICSQSTLSFDRLAAACSARGVELFATRCNVLSHLD